MGQQTLTLDFYVPDGYELTGEIRPPRRGEPNITLGGSRHLERGIFNIAGHDFDFESRVILRKAWEAPSCFPDGCWVYRIGVTWYVSQDEPLGTDTTCFHQTEGMWATTLAKLYGQNFTPPSNLGYGVNKIQVKRGD